MSIPPGSGEVFFLPVKGEIPHGDRGGSGGSLKRAEASGWGKSARTFWRSVSEVLFILPGDLPKHLGLKGSASSNACFLAAYSPPEESGNLS